MVPVLIVLLALTTIAVVVLVIFLVRSAAGRRTVAPGFARPPAQQRVVPQVRQPAPTRAAVASEVRLPSAPAIRPRAEVAAAPPSLIGPAAPLPTSLAGDVELGFEGDSSRVGIRGGSARQRAFAFYADQLLGDLRDAQGA